jgi:hypoxanthine phosphoribosyltransferase
MPLTADVKDRTVILVEDIVDSGFTMRSVIDKIKSMGAKRVLLATLLFKPSALKCDVKPDFVGISIPNEFIVGYGLDYDGLGRAYKDIYKISE